MGFGNQVVKGGETEKGEDFMLLQVKRTNKWKNHIIPPKHKTNTQH